MDRKTLPNNYATQLSRTGSIILGSPLYVSIFLMRFSFGLVLFTLPIYIPKSEFSNFTVGIVIAAYPIAETISGPVFGILADRLGRRRWIYIGLFIASALLFAFTLSTEVRYLIIIHGLEGVAAAMIVVSTLAMVTDVSTVSNRGREMGVYDFANLGGYVGGIFVAGLLVQTHFLLVPFYFGSALALFGAVFAVRKVKEKARFRRSRVLSPIQTLRYLFKDRRAAGMFPIWLSVTTFIGMALSFGPRFGPSPLLTSSILAGGVLVLAFTQPFFGHLSDTHGRDRLMMLGMLSLIGFFVTVIMMLRSQLSWLFFAPFVILFGAGSLAFPPAALALLGDFAPEKGRGTTMGVYSVVISLGTVVGPLLGGYLLDRYGVSSLFYAGLVILIAALAIAITLAGPNFSAMRIISTNLDRDALLND